MKNNLLDLKPLKACTTDSRIPISNDFLELMVTSKLEEGEFTDLSEAFERAFYDAYEESYCYDDDDDDDDDCLDMNEDSGVWERLHGETETETDSVGFLHAGYVDCMDEAIRFLVEEENISPEHPVVKNLKSHLEKSKERILGGFEPFETLSSIENLRGGDSSPPLGKVRNGRDTG